MRRRGKPFCFPFRTTLPGPAPEARRFAVADMMKIHFVSALTQDGIIIEAETNSVYEVKLEDDLTVEGSVRYLLENQGMAADVKNWNMYALSDGICQPISAGTTPATTAPEVVLVLKAD